MVGEDERGELEAEGPTGELDTAEWVIVSSGECESELACECELECSDDGRDLAAWASSAVDSADAEG